MCGLILMQVSFSFHESNAIFTDVSLFSDITTGDTRQSSSTSFIFSRCPDSISFSKSRPTSSCRCRGTDLAFCFIGYCLVSSWMLITVSIIVSLFSNKSGNLLNTFWGYDWLFSANCILPIVNLSFFIQSFHSRGVRSVLSIIRVSTVSLLFSYSRFTGILPRNFTSFLFTSWYL